jgi:hypothetical protein
MLAHQNGKDDSMETLLWAVNLLAVVYLCFWALRADGGLPRKKDKVK